MRRPSTAGLSLDAISAPCSREARSAEAAPLPETSATTADQQLGYRRFFDVNTLIGLRVEREFVFDETHALILKWLKQGLLDGVRVDHPDGLRDPKQYFERLRERAPEAWIVGEKILEPGEWLREGWPVE